MKKLFFLTLLCLSLSAEAEWSFVGKSAGISVYVDPASQRKTPTGAKVWMMSDRTVPAVRADGGLVRSFKALYEVDCALERVRILYVMNYAGPLGTGEPTPGALQRKDGVPIVPDTLGEQVFNEYCKPK